MSAVRDGERARKIGRGDERSGVDGGREQELVRLAGKSGHRIAGVKRKKDGGKRRGKRGNPFTGWMCEIQRCANSLL